ncbi:hypothetical protein MRX96_009974 [Rhipicephalus microplus]
MALSLVTSVTPRRDVAACCGLRTRRDGVSPPGNGSCSGPETMRHVLAGGGGGNFRESGGFRQTEGHRVEEGFKQTDFFNRGQGNGAAFLGTNAGVLESGLVQQVKGKFKIMGKLRGYSAAGSSLQQQG